MSTEVNLRGEEIKPSKRVTTSIQIGAITITIGAITITIGEAVTAEDFEQAIHGLRVAAGEVEKDGN